MQAARSAQAQAAATDTAGQNPDVVLYVLDGPAGTLDLVNVVKSWAPVLREAWVPESYFAKCHRAGRIRLNTAKSSTWRAVTGPTAATIATRVAATRAEGGYDGDDNVCAHAKHQHTRP